VTSFQKKIEENKFRHAYCQGIEAFRDGYMKKIVLSPFEKGTMEDLEWLDGFYDAWYLNIVTRGKNDRIS